MTTRDVPIEVTSRHEPVSDRMKEYATDKASKLLRFHNRISRIQIIADGVHGEPAVEMIVHVDSGTTLVAKEHQEHFKGAVDALVDKMERQLKKNNEKRKNRKNEARLPEEGGAEKDGEETYDDAVRRNLDA